MRLFSPRRLVLLGLLMGACLTAQAQPFHVLVFSKTAGFRHASIADGIAAVQALGQAHGFTVHATENAGVFTDNGLAAFEAVVFLNTTGDVLDNAQQEAFERYIRAGGGFVGIHAAADTEYGWPFYGNLVGAYFQSHPAIQSAQVHVADGAHPSTAGLPKRWTRTDEWYSYRLNPRGAVHVLATLDEATYSGGTMGHDHPIAWCQPFEGGRSWYTGGGHTADSYREPLFRQHLLGGLRYAAGVAGGDCTATQRGSFQKTVLETDVDDAVDLAVLPDGRVLFIEIDGTVRLHDPATSLTLTAAQFDVWEGNENGLIGVALDPSFAQNRWVYLVYTPAGPVSQQRLARFTLLGDRLDRQSERVLLDIPITREQCCHAGGSMAFDAQGNLFLGLGDDTNPFASDGYAPIDERSNRAPWDAQRSAANTQDLRGKILRITPQPDGTYTVPPGNLFADAAEGRPEIYVMGTRNPYRIAVDAETGWLYWGDVGPDARNASASRGPAGYDEWNQARAPGNYGWPYCIGPNEAYRDFDFATNAAGAPFDCARPTNTSPHNTGSQVLPPARPAWLWYPYAPSAVFPEIPNGSGRTAMAGPVYHFDPDLPSPTKLPAYYDGAVLLYEWSRNYVLEARLDEAGDLLALNPFAPDIPLARPISMRLGPDGALYVLEWGAGFSGSNRDAQLVRIDYRRGPQAPVAVIDANPSAGALPLAVTFSAAASSDPEGSALTYAWDFEDDGTVDATGVQASHTYTSAGAYTVRLVVTDADRQRGVTTATVVAGNTRPSLTITHPADGGFFAWGDVIPFEIGAEDAEDGSTASGTIDCATLTLQQYVGHDDHSHPTDGENACIGTMSTPAGHGGDGDEIFLVVEASYTDAGAPGAPPLEGRVQHRLMPRHLQAEHATTLGGVERQDTRDALGGRQHLTRIDDGDYAVFADVNLFGIRFMTFRVASAGTGGRIEIRADSVDGPLLGNAHVEWTGGWHTFVDVTTPVLDPGGQHDLYLVFRREPTNTNLFNLNWIDVHGRGVADRTARGDEGLTATYFATTSFTQPAATRIDPQISFDWHRDAPLPGLAADSFSVRWTGQVKAEASEEYTFTVRSAGALRLWLDGQLLLDRAAQATVGESQSAPVPLEAGVRYDFTAEFVHTAGPAQAKVAWQSASTAPRTVPARLLYPDATTGVATAPIHADGFALEPAFPNPVQTSATLVYTLPAASSATLDVFDLTGRRVAVLADGFHLAGRHTATWSADAWPSGLYLVRLTTPSGTRSQRLVVLR